MIAEPKFMPMSPQDYLAWEAQQDEKYAYVDGEVFAMTGGTIPHNLIAGNLFALLKSHVRQRGCRVFIADVKVQISRNGPYHYPDVMVSCDPRDKNAIKLIQYPCLIVEVLSPSTAAYDRSDKFTHYRQIPTLQDYVLIDAEKISIDRYRRIADRHWDVQTYLAGESLDLPSIDWEIPLERIYEDVPLSPQDDAEEADQKVE
ncbi:Uma2 family endonuclease [Phormidium sp. FACHB-1136]|uniref:Uma2 family endonuclease n=1 Tax=Phormidium sp. FACHB-1136 TaxID=2692848 RepID=UPI00168719A3|nr:Uma2 family endonuclease [Phormidium sp. FACHB-1136]MBD2427499.1 Uma2 family endonuclease [Phormidium sp. FACHB-1136]